MRGRIRDLITEARNEAQLFRARALSFADELLRPAPPVLDEIAASEDTSEILAPRDEVLLTHGQGDYKIYERLARHPQVYTTMKSRRAEVIARETRVEPGADDELSKAAATHLEEQLKKFGWDLVTHKMLGGLIPGNGYGECIFQLDKATGLVELPRVKVRPPGRFAFHRDGQLMLKRKGTPILVPERKVWVFRAASENDDDPYGEGLGQVLYWPVWFEKNALRFWSVFLERFANPTAKATVPPGTKEEDRNKLIALLGSIMNGGRIVVPRGVDVELIQAIRSSGGDFQTFIELLHGVIAKIVLGQTMTTDQGSSYAQSQIHYKVMQQRAKDDADSICESFCLGPATWLTEWNFPGAAVPLVYRDFSIASDLQARATLDSTLNTIGYRPRPKYVAEMYGDNYDFVPPAAAAPEAGGGLGFAEPLPRDSVSPLIENDGWRRVMQPQVEQIEQLLAQVTDLEEFRERLGEIALDNPHAMTEALARLMFTARVAGNVEAEEE